MVRLGIFSSGGKFEGLCAFFVGVGEDAQPVDLCGGDEVAELLEVGFGFAGEPHYEDVRMTMPGT